MSRPHNGGQTLSGSSEPMSRNGGAGSTRSTSAPGDRDARAAAAEQRARAAATRGAPKGPGKLGHQLAAEQKTGGTGGRADQSLPERPVVRF